MRTRNVQGAGTGQLATSLPAGVPRMGDGDGPNPNLRDKVRKPAIAEIRHEADSRHLNSDNLTMRAAALCSTQGGTATRGFIDALSA
jgi:hypothetical protein